mgnify:CR=1 FL=1
MELSWAQSEEVVTQVEVEGAGLEMGVVRKLMLSEKIETLLCFKNNYMSCYV